MQSLPEYQTGTYNFKNVFAYTPLSLNFPYKFPLVQDEYLKQQEILRSPL